MATDMKPRPSPAIDLKCLDRLVEICASSPINKLSVFGSRLRGDWRAESDLDLLVEFAPEARVGLIQKADVQNRLTEAIGCEVDLRTAAELSERFRASVVETAQELYACR